MSFVDLAMNAIRRVRFPVASQAVDDMLTLGKQSFEKAAPEARASFRNFNEAAEPIEQWLKTEPAKIGRDLKGTRDLFLSPDMVMSRHEAGTQIIDTMRDAEHMLNTESAKAFEPFEAVAKGVNQEGSTKVFKALENPTEVEKLSTKERGLYDHLKQQYDFSWKTYLLHKVDGDVGKFNKIQRFAAKGLSEDELKALDPQMQEAYQLAKQKIGDYAPHTWKKENLQAILENGREQNVLKYQKTTDPEAKDRYRKAIQEYEESLRQLAGGNVLRRDSIPKEILFRHGLLRKGALGYEEDAIRSYRSYIYSLNKKMYEEPALKKIAGLYNELPYEMRPYAFDFIRQWAGVVPKSPLDRLAGEIASFEYMRTLGLNLRSAITNLTQQVNTWAAAGHPKWSYQGYARAFTEEGEKAWKASGLGAEVPNVFTDELHSGAGNIEKLKRIMGVFFNWAETSNRKHAFLTGLTKAQSPVEKGGLGLGEAEAAKYARDFTYKTQFQYGRTGMPLALRTPLGRTAGQFSSFSIKQAEFLWKLAKESPLKAVTWAALAEGGNWTVGQTLGMDLSNALGFGISFGEAYNAFASMSKGEFDEAFEHGKLAFTQGSGILPSVPGPSFSGMKDIMTAISKGEDVSDALAKTLTPVAWQRVEDILASLKNRHLAKEEGKVPVGKRGEGLELKDIMFEQDIGKTISEIGPKSKERSEKSAQWYKESRMDILESKRKRLIAENIAAGNQDKAEALIKKYKIVPTREAIYEALLRRSLPRDLRPKYQKQTLRQLQREIRDTEEEE